MKNGTKHGMVFTVVALLVIVGLVLPTYAKSSGKTKTTKSIIGYCYTNGKTYRTTEEGCKKHKGVFFKDKAKAQVYQDAQTQGYCCLDDKVLPMKKGDCLKKKGKFFKEKKAALTYCDLHQEGYCCLLGKITEMLKGDCLKKKGTFYAKKKEALEQCQPRGWCVIGNRIFMATQSQCRKKRGTFYIKKNEAQRAMAKTKKAKTGKTSTASLSTGQMRAVKATSLLKFERVYVKGGTVRIQIKNKGRGKVTAKEYKEGTLLLALGKTRKSWPLQKIDPKGILKRNQSLYFDTGVKAGKESRVQVALRHVKGNPVKTVLLTQPVGRTLATTHAVKPNKTAGLKPPSKPMRAPGIKKSLTPVKTVRGKTPKPNGEAPDIRTRQLDLGVHILTPTTGYWFYRGERLRVTYQVTNNNYCGKSLLFKLIDSHGNAHYLSSHTAPSDRETTGVFETNMERDLSAGYYVIGVEYSRPEGGYVMLGLGNRFYIGYRTARVDIHGITPDEEYQAGDTLRLNYQLSNRIPPVTIIFCLYHHGDRIAEERVEYTPPPPSSAREYLREIAFPIPGAAPPGAYTIFAFTDDNSASGLSSRFTINPLEDSGRHQLTNGMRLEILEPHDLANIHPHDEVSLSVSRILPIVSINAVHIQLVNLDSPSTTYDLPEMLLDAPFTTRTIRWNLPAEVSPGRYRFFAMAEMSFRDGRSGTEENEVRPTAYSRVFSVRASYTPPEPDGITLTSPREGDRLPIDINVHVRWSADYRWEEGDKIVLRLMRDGRELYNREKWVAYGEDNLAYNSLVEPDAEGDYQVVVEHHRETSSGDQLISSATRTFHWYYMASPHCSSEHPVRILDVDSREGGRFIPGGTMIINFCYLTYDSNRYVRIVLQKFDDFTDERVVAERVSSTEGSYEWNIPRDLSAGRYRLYMTEEVGSGWSLHYVTIEEP